MECTVVTASKSAGIGSGLTYDTSMHTVQLGSHVRIPLRNSLVEGIVVDIRKKEDRSYALKTISALLGEKPLLSPAQINTMKWMSSHYCCSLRQALRVWLPSPPWSKLEPETEDGFVLLHDAPVRGAKQQLVVQHLREHGWTSMAELHDRFTVQRTTLKILLDRNIIERRNMVRQCDEPDLPHVITRPVLTQMQRAAYEKIQQSNVPSLLYGVTGSGKTEVYAQIIADVIESGKQALLLVPEILLTEYSIQRFQELIPADRLSVLHSRRTPFQRRSEWKRIHRGDVSLVIGSRSALFAPLHDLGVVIIDEEHEWTYKNEQTPRYHTRETAEVLCREAGARLVLGSATPSLESWSRAQSRKYTLAELPDRYNNRDLPSVRIIDLATTDCGTYYPFTPTLIDAIGKRLHAQEQVVLFLNRRGLSSALLCKECRRRIVSPQTQLPLSVHNDAHGHPFLFDHLTGLKTNVPAQCPHCNSVQLIHIGAGTQKVEKILSTLFPDAVSVRADSDVLSRPEDISSLLQQMQSGEASILFGTQSVVKGLDLPRVTLAAVLVADIGMSLPHFRASERTFQLLTQLTGRSGRAQPGEVIIQTFRPDANEITMAAAHRTTEFLQQELKLRTHYSYPPVVSMARLIVQKGGESRARHIATQLQHSNIVAVHCAPLLYDPKKRWHILVRGFDIQSVLTSIDTSDTVIDIDPIDCL